MKPANNGPQGPAEPGERRALPKGNPGSQSTDRTPQRRKVSQAANRVREAAIRKPEERLVALLHHLSIEALHVAYFKLRKDAAAGVDGMDWHATGQGLDERLADLHGRVHRGAYRAPPSRRVSIPKEEGGTRSLGIATMEDRLRQRAMVDQILEPIYEPAFLGFSDGFRPGRGAHNALDALTVGIHRRKVSWLLDADIQAFFDTVDRDWVIRFLAHRIGDKRVLRLITKWLNAGVMDGDTWEDTGVGTPQGGVVSALLANVYLHYVLDLWIHRKWRRRQATGDLMVVRYADDFVVGFQHRRDAEQFREELGQRLEAFGLALHPQKTRLLEFGRFAAANRKRRGRGKPETFDFLGMTHYCSRTRKGAFGVRRQPMRKRVSRTLNRIRAVLKRSQRKGRERVRWLGTVLRGGLNYYAVPGSSRSLTAFVLSVKRIRLKRLRRRSQVDGTSWPKVQRLVDQYWPKITIRHPWPEQRLVV